MALSTTRRTPRQRRAPTLAASPWPLTAAVVTVVAMAAVTGVDGSILQDSQVQFLRDCQGAWGNPSQTWTDDSDWDCDMLEFLICDPYGMILSLGIVNKQLPGPIPDSISNLDKLESLILSQRGITGSLPATIGGLTSLQILDLGRNTGMSGSLPTHILNLNSLTYLSMRGCNLQGSLPAGMGAMVSLAYIDVSYNSLTGPIPESLGDLASLTWLTLSSNQLSGDIPAELGSLLSLFYLQLSENELSGSIPESLFSLANLFTLALDMNQLTGTISALSNLVNLVSLSLASNHLYGSIPDSVTNLAAVRTFDLSHNFFTGPMVKPPGAAADLSSNYLSGALTEQPSDDAVGANCFTSSPAGATWLPEQRPEAVCRAFCGISMRANAAAAGAACGGRGLCYPDGPSLAPTCLCDAGFVQFGSIYCLAEGSVLTSPVDSNILPPATLLTKGTRKETKGAFTEEPVTLFVFEKGREDEGCRFELGFTVNFTFSLSPKGKAGSNGFAFVVSATSTVGSSDGVGYGGMDPRSMAIEFDVLQNKPNGDMKEQHVGLNVKGIEKSIAAVKSPFSLLNKQAYTAWVGYEPGDPGTIQVFLAKGAVTRAATNAGKPAKPLLERRLSLCEVLRGGEEEQLQAFYFGFVASTTVKPFTTQVILNSAMHADLPPPRPPVDITPCKIPPLSLIPCPLSLIPCPLSLIPCPLSLIPCPLSFIPCPLSLIPCPLSLIPCPLSLIPCPLSLIPCPLSLIPCPLSFIPCPLSLIPCPLSLIPCPLSLIPCPLSLIPCPLSLIPCPLSFIPCPLSLIPCPLSLISLVLSPLSLVLSPLSLVLSPLSLVLSPLSLVLSPLYPLSSLPYPLSSLPYPLSSLPYPLSSLPYPLSSLPYPLSSLPYPLSSLPYIPCPLSLIPCPLSLIPCPFSLIPCPLSLIACPLSLISLVLSPLSLVLSPLSLVPSPLSLVLSPLYPLSSLPYPLSSLPYPLSFLPYPLSSLPYRLSSLPYIPCPLSLIPCPLSLIPCPLSLIPCPLSLISLVLSPLSLVLSPLSLVLSPLSLVLSPLSLVLSPLSLVLSPLYPLSSLPYPLSSLPYPLSSLPYPLSSLPYPLSSLPYPLSFLPYPLSSLPYRLSSLPYIPCPLSLIPCPLSLIPCPLSLIPCPLSLISLVLSPLSLVLSPLSLVLSPLSLVLSPLSLILTFLHLPCCPPPPLSLSSLCQTFKYQDPACYSGNLNHVVLLVGYYILRDDGSQSRIAPPFWIIRNSWGEEWGDRGHMRMDIQGGDGVCSINVLPGIYPIVKIAGDPCGSKSYKGDGDLQPSMNPCGRFTCTAIAKTNSNTCTCSLPSETKQPFVEVANGYGNTCAYVDVCGSYFKNPCAVGTCINDGKGSYSCICPPNHVPSRTIDDFPTCDPANGTATSLTVSGDKWACADVFGLVGLSSSHFAQQNPDINCSQPLLKDAVLRIAGTPAIPCTGFFYTLNGDKCVTIASSVGITKDNLMALNPGLDCTQAIKPGRSLCVERNATYAYTAPECLKYATLTAQDTCERLLKGPGVDKVEPSSWAALYRNNPGLVCSNTVPGSVSAVGSNIGVQNTGHLHSASAQKAGPSRCRHRSHAPVLTASMPTVA
ncbi:unnamed protein product [Closterium sp. Naga37s-1]|nr:unnamed protein product [Closterium sp. Naga37s-1]